MGLGNNQNPQREFGTRVNQSQYGMPYPVVIGTAQVEQSLLWVDGFAAVPAPTGKGVSGGGGKGGGKNTGEYLYSADVVAALCNGPIQGVGDVWSQQSWLGSPLAAEEYTISSGSSYSYTPTNASTFYNDLGVGVQNTFSGSYSDIGAPSATVLSGTDVATMTAVPYGTSLTTGLYSINPTGNVYVFASADTGRVVIINYSHFVTAINRQENDIVPSGRSIQVGSLGAGSTVNVDLGVVYTTTGVAFTIGSGTGQYTVSGLGSTPATYSFASGDINALVTISFTVNDPNAVSPGETTSLNYTLQNGTQGQSPYSYLTASYPDAAFGYTNIATLLYQPMDLGMSSEIQENRFEVITYDIFGQGIQDCNPVQCVEQVLTNGQWGLGVGSVPFPTGCIDNSSSGTWGASANTPGARSVASTAWNWFAAQNFFISPVLDSQDTAATTMSKWLEAGMCAAFFSEGLLKLVPYGDTSAASNGVTWTAPADYIAALDDTCFLTTKEGEDPVKTSRVSAHDAWNVVQVQWDNRLNQYAPEVTQESDQSLINRWGERREDPQDWDFIHTVSAATFAANMRIKHNSYIRNTYEFSLPYGYSYLEPMDIVTLTTSSVWAAGTNNINLGVVNLPVRVTKIVDDPIKGLAITCEDYPWGAHQPTLYNKQLNESTPVANAYVDPGNSEVVMFEATDRLTGFNGDQIWIGALGTGDNWGSCNIWVSQDNTTYSQVGTIKSPARLGELHSTFASGSDPDSTHSLVVDLAENCGPFEAGTTTDADSGNTMCFVDGEIISYSALTYSGQNQITMGTYIRRGQYGSSISSHSSSSLFMRLDSAIYKYTYDPTFRGQTLYFKFQSVNSFGLMAQDLSGLTPITFTLPGTSIGTVDASTGVVVSSIGIPLGLVGTTPTNGGVSNGTENFSATASGLTYRPETNPLTGHDAGSNATINIASFTMLTSANGAIAISSGSVTTLSYSTLYYVYYSDPTLAGGSVTFLATTTKTTAINGAGNFFVGSIVTPAATGSNTVGNNDGGVGAQSGSSQIFLFGSVTEGIGAGGALITPDAAFDGNLTTYATIFCNSGSSDSNLTLIDASPTSAPWSTFTLNVLSQVIWTNGSPGNGVATLAYSLNGGSTFTNIYVVTNANRALTQDSIALPLNQNLALVQVKASVTGDISFTGTEEINLYQGWALGLQ